MRMRTLRSCGRRAPKASPLREKVTMPKVSVERRLPFAPEALRALVADVRAYPRFIPWIKAMRVSDEREQAGARAFLAEAIVGFMGLTERFATYVTEDRRAQTVAVRLARGPFRCLENVWRFQPAGEGAVVHFSLDYEFKNPLLGALAQANAERAAQLIMNAFVREAQARFAPAIAANGALSAAE